MSDFSVYRGDDLTFNLVFTDSDGVAIDITNWKIYFTMKKSKDYTDTQAAVIKNVTSHTDPTNGKTKITIGHDDMNDLFGNYYYDIQYKNDTNEIHTILVGTIWVFKDITRRNT